MHIRRVISCVLAINVSFFSMLQSCLAESGQDEVQIKAVINKAYDQPNAKVIIEPVVLAHHYALADWIQLAKGGRALLMKSSQGWEIMACGGDGFKDVQYLQKAGLSKEVAQLLVHRLVMAEKKLTEEHLKQLGSFDAPHHVHPVKTEPNQ